MTYFAFIDAHYEGSHDCAESAPLPDGVTRQMRQQRCFGGRAFYCNEPSDPGGLRCYGSSGAQILDTLHIQFEILKADYDWVQALACITAVTWAHRRDPNRAPPL